MRLCWLISEVAALVLCTSALGADLAVKTPPTGSIASAAVNYNWTGFYLGGNAGWVRQFGNGTSNFTQPLPLTNTPLTESVSDDSFIGGLQAGYNWQLAPHWVVGIEGDWQWTDPSYSFCRQTDTLPGGVCVDNGVNNRGIITVSSKTDWLATIRGRLGWTWDRFFIYGTGGGAWGSIKTTLTASCAIDGCGNSAAANVTSVNFSDTKSGWAAGLGVEAFFYKNWTAKVEWLHIDLGTATDAFTAAPALGLYGASWSRNLRFDTVRLGVNYKLF